MITGSPVITDSGVRRIGRSTYASLRKFFITYILPTTMAPRKKSDEDVKPVVDQSAVIWRAFVTVILVTICPWTRPFLGMPPDAGQSDKRLVALEEKVDKMNDKFTSFVDSINFRDANSRWPRK